MKNWNLPAIFKSPYDDFAEDRAREEKRAHIEKLSRTGELVIAGANQMTEAHKKLTKTKGDLKNCIEVVRSQDLTVLKDSLDTYDLTDEYRDQLKQELERTKEKIVAELEPLLETAERLLGNIVVSQYKAQAYAMVIRGKAEVIDSAMIQVDKLKKLEGEGKEISAEIEKLLKDCEELNNIALSGGTGISQVTSNPFDLINQSFSQVNKMKDVTPGKTNSAGSH